MPKLTIDGREIDVPAGLAVIQACELAGIQTFPSTITLSSSDSSS